MNSQKKEEILKRMNELILSIEKWDYEYYVLNNPSVEDSVYDQKIDELKELELKSSIVLDNSPTIRLNSKIYDNSKLRLVKRSIPMLSIDNTNNKDGLITFDKKIRKELDGITPEYICELKIDGLSASILYENHQLIKISTRGDGLFGEDVTFNKEIIKKLPFQITSKEFSEVRGEIYMKKKDFFELNNHSEKGIKKLANARNAASGTLRTLSSSNKKRKLYFFAYQYLTEGIETQEQCLKKLTEDGFETVEYSLCKNLEEVFFYIEEVSKKRDEFDFSIDGIVVKVNQYSDCKKLGETSKFPRWAIAYKFTPSSAASTIKAINTAVSKNGRITYVALVGEVNIAGSLIKNVTLHNFAFIKKKMLNIGDKILINKAGDVIPQIVKILQKKEKSFWQAPIYCPSCSSKLTWEDNYLYQICPNSECQERNINYLTFFASKSAANIRGVSKSIIEKLSEFGLVKKPYDFYSLKFKNEDLRKIKMFKEKSLTNLLDGIDKSRYKNFANFTTAFSIPLLSFVKAQKLAKMFNENIKEFLTFIKNGDFTLLRIKLGEKTGISIEKFFQNKVNLENFEKTSLQMIFI